MIQNLSAEDINENVCGRLNFEFEEQFENETLGLIDENESFADEISSEDIHITNRDFVEEIEPEIYFSEQFEIAEPEFVEEQIEKESPADRHIMNSFGAYSQPKTYQINKTYALTAGVLAVVFFGVFITATVSERQNNETSSSVNPSPMPANLNISGKEKVTVGNTDEILIKDQNPNREEIEPPKSNEKIVQTDYSEAAPNNESKKSSPPNAEKNTERKNTAVKTVKKQNKNERKSRRNETVAKKDVVEKTKSSTNSAAGMTRPRIVTNVKAND